MPPLCLPRPESRLAPRSCFLVLASLFLALGCMDCQPNRELQTQLLFTLNTYVKAVNQRNSADLEASVVFPSIQDYRGHVNNLILRYLDAVKTGKLAFDPQGVLVIRFLGLGHHRFYPLKVEPGETPLQAKLRIGVHFAYDSNLNFSDLEEGTQVFIPAEPWGTVHTITIGEENDAPRSQLSYAEIVFHFARETPEAPWKVTRCEVDRDQLEYETSYQTSF